MLELSTLGRFLHVEFVHDITHTTQADLTLNVGTAAYMAPELGLYQARYFACACLLLYICAMAMLPLPDLGLLVAQACARDNTQMLSTHYLQAKPTF